MTDIFWYIYNTYIYILHIYKCLLKSRLILESKGSCETLTFSGSIYMVDKPLYVLSLFVHPAQTPDSNLFSVFLFYCLVCVFALGMKRHKTEQRQIT